MFPGLLESRENGHDFFQNVLSFIPNVTVNTANHSISNYSGIVNIDKEIQEVGESSQIKHIFSIVTSFVGLTCSVREQKHWRRPLCYPRNIFFIAPTTFWNIHKGLLLQCSTKCVFVKKYKKQRYL